MTEIIEGENMSARQALLRGLRLRCPRCGEGALFGRHFRINETCSGCSFDLETRAVDTWALIYFSTAALTGVVIVGILVIRPFNLVLGRFALTIAALVIVVFSLPFRKGAAIAFNYVIEERFKTLHGN